MSGIVYIRFYKGITLLHIIRPITSSSGLVHLLFHQGMVHMCRGGGRAGLGIGNVLRPSPPLSLDFGCDQLGGVIGVVLAATDRPPITPRRLSTVAEYAREKKSEALSTLIGRYNIFPGGHLGVNNVCV